ncbi:MAG: hypothetical protein ABIO94_09335 [Opitutaceae bacterium]
MNSSLLNSRLSPRAIQNARTRIFVSGSDPRFASPARASSPVHPRAAGVASTPRIAPYSQRLFSPGLLDRLQAPLTRYTD